MYGFGFIQYDCLKMTPPPSFDDCSHIGSFCFLWLVVVARVDSDIPSESVRREPIGRPRLRRTNAAVVGGVVVVHVDFESVILCVFFLQI